MARFIQYDRYRQYLLPPSVDEWLPEDHLARYIVEVIDQLDLSTLASRYSRSGSAAYHPALMLALLIYGYATGTFSSRKIERTTHDSVAFRFIAANLHPDHDTLAHFRKTFLVELEDIFAQVLAIAQTMRLVKLGQISLDGTKIKANASKHKALSHGHIEKLEAQLREEVQALLAKAAETDQQEASDEHDLPAEIARREQCLQALADAKAKIAERAAQRDNHAQQDYADKVARREAQREAGQKPRGKELKAPETGPKAADQINLTDEESRIMPSHEGFVLGYLCPVGTTAKRPSMSTACSSSLPHSRRTPTTNSKSSRCWTNWLNWKAVSANPTPCWPTTAISVEATSKPAVTTA